MQQNLWVLQNAQNNQQIETTVVPRSNKKDALIKYNTCAAFLLLKTHASLQ